MWSQLMHDRTRIAVIDDHPLFRDGVIHTLRTAPDIEVVAEGATAQDALEIGRCHAPHIMLLDISMPGCGLEAARELRQTCPKVKAVMLTASENEHHVQTALRYGVNGYIVKGCSGPELLRIIRTV